MLKGFLEELKSKQALKDSHSFPVRETIFFVFSVHAGGGLWGVISVPLLAKENSVVNNFDKQAFHVSERNQSDSVALTSQSVQSCSEGWTWCSWGGGKPAGDVDDRAAMHL